MKKEIFERISKSFKDHTEEDKLEKERSEAIDDCLSFLRNLKSSGDIKKYSDEIVKSISEHLQNNGVKLVAFDATEGVFGFVMHLPGPISFVNYIIQVGISDYTVIAISPVGPDANDAEALAAMAEFVCRANHGLKQGSFELDFRDGELRYYNYIDCGTYSFSQMWESIVLPGVVFRRYAPAIINVLYKGMNVTTALQDCDRSRLRELEEAKEMLERLKHVCDTNTDDEDSVTVSFEDIKELFDVEYEDEDGVDNE